MIRRRTITPVPFQALLDPFANRRTSSRRELSERVCLWMDERKIPGWTLNVSVGGLRAIIEEPIEPGMDVMVSLGTGSPRLGRIVWVQDEPDGSIIGVHFLAPLAPPVRLSGA